MMQQLELFAYKKPINPVVGGCLHNDGFHTNSVVPGGLFCCECQAIVLRDLPPTEDEPSIIGYVTANWAWKYRHGNDWTLDS
ncbi:MAG: hypothetical protein COB22_05985 [Cycloclasticus sp.]|nr:MAG: hypothetical protein COB22_05985 [Cycloclasticus sp.]